MFTIDYTTCDVTW